jgi:rod shape determining protein RodA
MVLISLLLSAIGIGLIFSATAPAGEMGKTLVIKQMAWACLGVVLMAVLLLLDYRFLERWAVWLYVTVVALLVAAWPLGRVTAGSQRWLEIGLARFQPSEIAKLALVVILAKYLQNRPAGDNVGMKGLVVPVVLTLVPAMLVLFQPDMGTAAVLVLIAISMILFAGVGRRVLLGWAVAILAAAPILYFVGDRLLLDYQKKRLVTFLNPAYDPLGAGYHILQSQIAIGSGGALGTGFLKGTQNQLMFLPVKHTDFIFAVLAEEWGFVGCMVVLVLFSALLLSGLAITGRAADGFGALASFGCTAILFWHLVVNVGMVTGLVPVVGVPLSFLSYGGSSLVACFAAVSIIANVSMRRFSY